MKKTLLIIFGTASLLACKSKTDCEELSGTYSTFVEARKDITKANYPIKKFSQPPKALGLSVLNFTAATKKKAI